MPNEMAKILEGYDLKIYLNTLIFVLIFIYVK